MRSPEPTAPHREEAILVAHDCFGNILERITLGLHEYWEGLHEVIDSATYREAKGIARVTGVLYSSSGSVLQEFQNAYGPQGRYVSG